MDCSVNEKVISRFHGTYERISQDQVLGRGSYGLVCEYMNKQDGARYAVKEIAIEDIPKKSPKVLAKEGVIGALVDHVNIARFVECFIEIASVYLVFELVDGKDLFTEICAKPCYSERDASSYIRQLLSAVEYCHDKDIVHADVKPDNILLRPCDDTIKLIDFGLAFRAKDDKRDKHSNRGTILYMAPETANNEPFGKPIDLWSCGVILYNMLSGVHPFTVLRGVNNLDELKTKRFKFPSPYFDGTSQDARNLISGLLRRNQDKRETASLALKYPFINDIELSNTEHRQLAIDGLDMFFSLARYRSLNSGSGEFVNPAEAVPEIDLQEP